MTTDSNTDYHLPTLIETDQGEIRRAGFELEFSGISPDASIDAVRSSLNAETCDDTPADTALQVDGPGEIKIELDWGYLKLAA